MRSIGVSERALYWLMLRASERVVFGQPVLSRSNVHDVIAETRLEIEQCRLLTLQAALLIDKHGAKGAFQHIAMVRRGLGMLIRVPISLLLDQDCSTAHGVPCH